MRCSSRAIRASCASSSMRSCTDPSRPMSSRPITSVTSALGSVARRYAAPPRPVGPPEPEQPEREQQPEEQALEPAVLGRWRERRTLERSSRSAAPRRGRGGCARGGGPATAGWLGVRRSASGSAGYYAAISLPLLLALASACIGFRQRRRPWRTSTTRNARRSANGCGSSKRRTSRSRSAAGPRPLEGFAGGHSTWTGQQDDAAAAEVHADDARRSIEDSEEQVKRADPKRE